MDTQCETVIIKLVSDILWAMENQQVTAVIALDLSVAFNMVDHELLLSVLKHNLELEGKVLNWFHSYLHPRSYKVSIRKEYSLEPNLPFSVPQGSYAEAQIFNLYCSTIQEVINPHLNLCGFADDYTVESKLKPGHCDDEVRCMCELEKCVVDLKVWMDENQLKMNSDKTELILFGLKPQLDKCIKNL